MKTGFKTFSNVNNNGRLSIFYQKVFRDWGTPATLHESTTKSFVLWKSNGLTCFNLPTIWLYLVIFLYLNIIGKKYVISISQLVMVYTKLRLYF